MPHDFKTCPYCGNSQCEAEFTDVGVGYVQTGPYHCYECGATQIGPYDKMTPTPEESACGWYAPSREQWPDTVSTIDGRYVDPQTARDLYCAGLVAQTPFHITSTDLQKKLATLVA